MERSLLETVDLLGLDVMLASIAILLTLVTAGDFVRRRHQEPAAPQRSHAEAVEAPSRPELVLPDWFGPSGPSVSPARPRRSPGAEPAEKSTPARPRETEVA
jgi:hypothetical protein